jgi:hypothetical protein
MSLLLAILLAATSLLSPAIISGSIDTKEPVYEVQEAVPDPLTCVGYPEPRVWIEEQGWWQDSTGEAFPGRHVHVGTCWPVGAITGTFSTTLRVILHAQPSGAKITGARISECGTSGSCSGNPWPNSGSPLPKWNPIDSNGDMVQMVPMSFNTTGWSTGGHEMRLAVFVDQPSGAKQFVSGGWPLFVGQVIPFSRGYVESRGWYTKFEYINARYHSGLAALLNPVPETWRPVVECARPSGHAAITSASAHVDPNMHEGNKGIIYPFATSGKVTLSINTTGLAQGIHRLVIVCGAKANLSSIANGTDSGVMNIPFKVGGTPTPTPTPTITPIPTVNPTPTPSVIPTPTPTGTPGTGNTFIALEDAKVNEQFPESNYGNITDLRVLNTTQDYQSYLKFNSTVEEVSSAKVRLFVTDSSPYNTQIFVTSMFSESTLRWSNKPPLGVGLGTAIGSVAGQWIEYDVSSVVNGAGTYYFVVAGGGSNSLFFSSSEGANQPQLVVN